MVHENLYCATFLHDWQHLLGNEGYRNNLMILLCHFLKVGLLLYMIFVHLHYVLIDRYPRFLFVGHLFLFQLRKIFERIFYKRLYYRQTPNSTVLYSEVPNRRADRNKRAGLEKNSILPAFLLSKLINEQGGLFITWKISNMVERKSEKSKRACSSIRDFRVCWVVR